MFTIVRTEAFVESWRDISEGNDKVAASLTGVEFVLARNPQYYGYCPGSESLRVAVTRPLPDMPVLHIYYTVDNAVGEVKLEIARSRDR